MPASAKPSLKSSDRKPTGNILPTAKPLSTPPKKWRTDWSATAARDAGGRHYFTKDAHTTPDAIRRGYPRLDEWKAVRDSVDPHGVWQSDLSRRLGLTD